MVAKIATISFMILFNVLNCKQSITKNMVAAPISRRLETMEQRISGEGCSKKADIVFVLDASKDYQISKLYSALTFISSVVSTFEVSLDTIRVGMVIYSTNSYSPFDLDDYTTVKELQTAIKRVRLSPGKRNSPEALQRAFSMLTHENAGARPFTEAQHVLIHITDGPSINELYYTTVDAIHEATIESYGIGIGSAADFDQLVALVSYPRYEHLFMIEDYKAITGFAMPFSKKVCSNIYEPSDMMDPGFFSKLQMKRSAFDFKRTGPKQEEDPKPEEESG